MNVTCVSLVDSIKRFVKVKIVIVEEKKWVRNGFTADEKGSSKVEEKSVLRPPTLLLDLPLTEINKT